MIEQLPGLNAQGLSLCTHIRIGNKGRERREYSVLHGRKMVYFAAQEAEGATALLAEGVGEGELDARKFLW